MRGRLVDCHIFSQAFVPRPAHRRCPPPCCQASAEAAADAQPEKQKFLRLQQTPEERSAPPPDIIDQAEESLQDYCLALPDDDSSQSERCWEAFNYFEDRKEAATATCSIEELEGMKDGPGCGDRDRFQDFVRSSRYDSIKNFVGSLATLARMQKRDASESDQDPSKAQPGEVIGIPDGGRDELVRLFQAMDKDGNGKLDTGEFRDAMSQLQGSLSGDMVSTIFQSMGIQGYITLDEFLDIAEVEGQVSHTPLNTWLQRKTRSDLTAGLPSGML